MSTTNPTEQPNEKQGALHTEGPWTAPTGASREGVFHVRDARNYRVALTYKMNDALVVAAAPDLLAACRSALPLIENYVQGREDVMDELTAAIAKAEGR